MLPSTRNPTLVLGCSPQSLLPLLSFRTKISLHPTQKRRLGSGPLFLRPRSGPRVTTPPIRSGMTIPRTFLLKKACSPLLPSLTSSCPRLWRLQGHHLRSRSSPTMSRRQNVILRGPSSALNPSGNDGPIHISRSAFLSNRHESVHCRMSATIHFASNNFTFRNSSFSST